MEPVWIPVQAVALIIDNSVIEIMRYCYMKTCVILTGQILKKLPKCNAPTYIYIPGSIFE